MRAVSLEVPGLVSIIVPVYNTEMYLRRCIDSLLAQIYDNVEIILVNDGSTDSSPDICDAYAHAHSCITVLHKPNGGLSEARNFGIDVARGEYITFVDSDDYVHPSLVDTLVSPFSDAECDISVCQLHRVYDSTPDVYNSHLRADFSMVSGIQCMYPDFYTSVACGKLYRRSLFENIRFPVGKIHEDEATTYKLYYSSRKIAITDRRLYFYFMSPNSIMRTAYSRKNLDIVPILEEKLRFLEEHGEHELYGLTLKRYCSTLLRHYYLCKKYLPNSDNIQRQLLSKFKSHYKRTLGIRQVRLSSRLFMAICRLVPSLYGSLVVKDEHKWNAPLK